MAVNFGGHLLRQFGAYIRTDLSALQDIAGVPSGVIGIIGLAEKGPVDEAVTITGYSQLVEVFGSGPLVMHGLAAYVGGASTVIAIRTGSPDAASLTAIDATPGASTPPSYVWNAREMGSLGNNTFISVESQDQDTVDTADDTYVVRVKYIDGQGNDIRETFVLPHFIPDTTGMYYDNNPGNYYILRNRETGTISEVPTTWGFGNADEDAFLEKVEDMKSTAEDLIGPFPYGTGDNPYPLALVASVINYGGLGQSASSLVTLDGAGPNMTDFLAPGYTYDPSSAEELLPHPFVQMSGGNNGDDGTNYYGIYDDVTQGTDWTFTYEDPDVMSAWDESLGIMEDEEVNFVQPAYLFNRKPDVNDPINPANDSWDGRFNFYKTLIPKFLSHIPTMSNIPNRKFRTMVTGLPYFRTGENAKARAQDFLDEIEEISGLLNDDRVQLWAGGFKSSAFSPGIQEYGGEMLASFVVGAHASRDVSTSLTFAQLSGIFTDGLEFAWNQAQKDELYTRGHAFVLKRRTASGALEYVAANNYTSFTGASSRGMQLFLTRRIVDYVSSFIYKNIEENYIGRKSRGAETAAAIEDFTSALLNRMVREDVLVTFANVRAEADPIDKTKYFVYYDIQPVTEIQMVLVTQRLLYTLA